MEEDEDAAMDEFQEDEMDGIVPGKDLGLDQKNGIAKVLYLNENLHLLV